MIIKLTYSRISERFVIFSSVHECVTLKKKNQIYDSVGEGEKMNFDRFE